MSDHEHQRNESLPHDCCCCPQPSAEEAADAGFNRREFITLASTFAAAGAVLTPMAGLAARRIGRGNSPFA